MTHGAAARGSLAAGPQGTASPQINTRPCVLVFAGADPSGGAGVYADVQAIAANGAHALPVITVLTVQDNNRVHAIFPVPAGQVGAQAAALHAAISIAAVKIGIVGSRANAECIAALLTHWKTMQPDLPVVLDPVLASGHGDALTREDALAVLEPLLAHATLVTPNLPEAAALCGIPGTAGTPRDQATALLLRGARNVLVKGGHANGTTVDNFWLSADGSSYQWHWPRLPGAFHGSGCTLASAIAARLAGGATMREALQQGQAFCHHCLVHSFAIGRGQRIPERSQPTFKEPT